MKRLINRVSFFISSVLFVIIVLFTNIVYAEKNEKEKLEVLFISSYSLNFISFEDQVQGIRERLNNNANIKIEYIKSLKGSTKEIAKQIIDFEISDKEYYLTARLETSNLDGTKTFQHTVSINGDAVFWSNSDIAGDYLIIKINDTSSANRQQVKNDIRKNSIMRVDVFRVVDTENNTN